MGNWVTGQRPFHRQTVGQSQRGNVRGKRNRGVATKWKVMSCPNQMGWEQIATVEQSTTTTQGINNTVQQHQQTNQTNTGNGNNGNQRGT